jgi:type IV secretion system protein VirB1
MMNIAPQILLSLFAQCAADVAPETLNTLINVESSRNPYAIAVVYDKSVKDSDKLTFSQPSSEDEALRIIDQLTAKKTHKSYSVGIMQVNSTNFQKYGINRANMFDACKNISTLLRNSKTKQPSRTRTNPIKTRRLLLLRR